MLSVQRVSLHKGTPKTANRKITPFEAHLQEKMQFTAYLRGSVSIQDHKGPKVKGPKRVPKDPSVFVKCQKILGKKTKMASMIHQNHKINAGIQSNSKSILLERIPLKIPNQNMPKP